MMKFGKENEEKKKNAQENKNQDTRENAKKSIIIFLDSIDQLSAENSPFLMKWLPKTLKSRVKIVISTLPENCCDVISNLKVGITFYLVLIQSEFQNISVNRIRFVLHSFILYSSLYPNCLWNCQLLYRFLVSKSFDKFH